MRNIRWHFAGEKSIQHVSREHFYRATTCRIDGSTGRIRGEHRFRILAVRPIRSVTQRFYGVHAEWHETRCTCYMHLRVRGGRMRAERKPRVRATVTTTRFIHIFFRLTAPPVPHSRARSLPPPPRRRPLPLPPIRRPVIRSACKRAAESQSSISHRLIMLHFARQLHLRLVARLLAVLARLPLSLSLSLFSSFRSSSSLDDRRSIGKERIHINRLLAGAANTNTCVMYDLFLLHLPDFLLSRCMRLPFVLLYVALMIKRSQRDSV